jgi:RNA polymerase sigma-70 factor, ECF subfamily
MNGPTLLDPAHSPTRSDASASQSSCNEADLIRRLKARDAAAFEHVVRSYTPRLAAVARRLLGANPQEIDDAVQDAFLSAYKALDRFEGNALLSTWLHRITVNAALMRLRSRNRRRETGIEDIEALMPRWNDDGHRRNPRVAWETPAEALAEREEVRQLVRNRIDRLPDDYRTVILLRDIEELDTDTTAEMLGITPGAVKTRLHRARMALREMLEVELT